MAKYKLPKSEELSKIDYKPGSTDWMDTPVTTPFEPGTFCWGAKGRNLETVGFPNARD
ncbi:MAG TPA: (Fe-S)-binding protein, partial [Desulfitobacterium dehalogenans]|nr:(Fe-S)-binding protein [Desulfitobacterium dehalogenans]